MSELVTEDCAAAEAATPKASVTAASNLINLTSNLQPGYCNISARA
jgi:hypothetical protein